jgi:sortase A
MTPRSRWWSLLEGGALSLGLLLLGLWAHEEWNSWAFQSAASKELAAASRHTERASSPAKRDLATSPERSARNTPRRTDVLGRLEIPRLRIRAIVAEGTDAKTLGRAIGHVRSTSLPGRPGNCGLAGHRDSFLRDLRGVRPNDLIRFTTPERTYTYVVEWSKIVEPDRVDALHPTRAPALTLVTCYPFEFVGRARQRFVVRARQVDAGEVPAAFQARAALPSRALSANGR